MQPPTVQDWSLLGLSADQTSFVVMLPKSVQSHSHFLSTEIDKAKSNHHYKETRLTKQNKQLLVT